MVITTEDRKSHSIDSLDQEVAVPPIFPRCHRASSEFRRLRRPRLVYIAGYRRARSEAGR